jgi:hypothetical protein
MTSLRIEALTLRGRKMANAASKRRAARYLQEAATAYDLLLAQEAEARGGSVDAHYWLGCEFTSGRSRSVTADAAKGAIHLQYCAEHGHANAMLRLAAMYMSTAPVPGYDPVKTMELLIQAGRLASRTALEIVDECEKHAGKLATVLSRHVSLEWPIHVESAARFPLKGFAPHPGMSRRYNLDRSRWNESYHEPQHRGQYEMLVDGQLDYGDWDGRRWFQDGRPCPAPANWRGLANDPDVSSILYVDPPGPLLPGVSIGGYVEHCERGSPFVRTIHVARSSRSKEGDLLTMCRHVARGGMTLRLWCNTEKIKVVDGHQPDLCAVCVTRTFERPASTACRPGTTEAAPAIDSEAFCNPTAQQIPRMSARRRYAGEISYENWHTGSAVRLFEPLGDNHFAVELISRVDEEGVLPSFLKAIARRVAPSGPFTTGMVQLVTSSGEEHPFGRSEFSFEVVAMDSDRVTINGVWQDEGGHQTKYPFSATLPSVRQGS